MKTGFYPRLAADGIRKNKRMYLPFILTCTGMVMMYYIVEYLATCDVIDHISGGATMRAIFELGSWVIAIFAAIFLFYTNSFLMRRRKKEFGLYNILGMGKRNIAGILFWEIIIIAAISTGGGLLAGIAFSKFAELGMVNVMHGEVTYSLSISVVSVLMTLIIFGIIFLLLLLNSIRQVHFSSAVSLLRSENAGEKPPKGNLILGIIGILLLVEAYYLAVTIQNPVVALVIFFLAVVMVILGTYLVMISGSVVFCRILQKNKSYYYKPNHFISISSMAYRMKRNGAGLASICILATMVLVMLSSTACLYFGEESAINLRYPREINLSFSVSDNSYLSDENVNAIFSDIDEAANSHGVNPENIVRCRQIGTGGMLKDGYVTLDVTAVDNVNLDTYSNVYQFYFMPLSDYNAMSGKNETLNDGEALMYVFRGNFNGNSISFENGRSFEIAKTLDSFVVSGNSAMLIMPTIMLIVPDLSAAIQGIDRLANYNGDPMLSYEIEYDFDTGKNTEIQNELYIAIWNKFRAGNDTIAKYGIYRSSVASRDAERQDFYRMFGSLFYIGIILSLVFIIAAVLIIYYKQISEGYEDQARFEIMQKVGMTKRDIRKTINSQLLTVFFLPLVFAAMHITFAFPIIQKLLLMFNLNNVPLFAATTAISAAVFAVFYTIVYKLTSNAYYKIVSGFGEDGK
ncbi:MAG: ABC transporter permease [Oscillospiraceae bacterium]|nr:ABC transporter permease [Oscillospiraceae bacterium]